MSRKNTNQLTIGKHILDTLSIGMYNNPLMLFREYIQNSADAIDQIACMGGHYVRYSKIEIIINGKERSITIRDNATGIKAKDVLKKLHDIGRSSKKTKNSRGFRGIGRLGGLGYCEELRFITKSKGESRYSVSKWDCAKLRTLISSSDNDSLDAIKLVETIAELEQYKYTKDKSDQFFIVEMHNVRSSRNVLLDVPVIRSYLSQVVPVPFKDEFSHKEGVEKKLRSKIFNYETYKIIVNGAQVFKPYIDLVKVGEKNVDKIKEVEFLEFSNGNGISMFGWIAKLSLLGKVSSTGLVDGVRLRSGNILVGDKDLLCDYFRERRFNSYLVGELHVVDHRLVLNSRRDDFEDSQYKEEFYNNFVRDIGLPFSRKIREASEGRSNDHKQLLNNKLVEAAKGVIKRGYVADSQKQEIAIELDKLKNNNTNSEDIDNLLSLLDSSVHFLNAKGKKSKLSSPKKVMLKSIFDIIYEECTNKDQAESIIQKIIKQV
jgi:hypothetical protein